MNRITPGQTKNPELLNRFINEMVEELGKLRGMVGSGGRNGMNGNGNGNGMETRTAAQDIAERRKKDNVLSGVQTGAAALVELGIDKIATAKSNFEATGPPTTDDDNSKGYSIGSIWIYQDTFPQEIYMCVLPTTAAANWVQIG